jgi:putative hydrolase of the HAD superfamily
MSIRAVIFDFGMVVGYFNHHLASAALARFGQRTEADIYEACFHGPLEDDFEAGRIGAAEFLAQLRRRCALTGSDDELGKAYSDIFWPNDDVIALIPSLKPRYRLLLGSNTSVLHANRFREQFAEALRPFDALVLSFEIGVRKPAGRFYEVCVEKAGCAPSECVFIDDMPANIAGAQALGLHGILYCGIDDLRERLRALDVAFA